MPSWKTAASDDDMSVDIWSKNGEADDVEERPQRTYHADENHELGEVPSSKWGKEEEVDVVKEEGLAFGVPYWDQVSTDMSKKLKNRLCDPAYNAVSRNLSFEIST